MSPSEALTIVALVFGVWILVWVLYNIFEIIAGCLNLQGLDLKALPDKPGLCIFMDKKSHKLFYMERTGNIKESCVKHLEGSIFSSGLRSAVLGFYAEQIHEEYGALDENEITLFIKSKLCLKYEVIPDETKIKLKEREYVRRYGSVHIGYDIDAYDFDDFGDFGDSGDSGDSGDGGSDGGGDGGGGGE